MLSHYRQKDAVLVICQNNETQRIEVAGMNDKAREVTGYNDNEIIGKSLDEFLMDKMAATLRDYVEFGVDKKDAGDVLSKVHDFHVRNKDGQYTQFRLRVVRSEVLNQHPMFHLVLQDEAQAREDETFKRVLKENFKGHEIIDDVTGLPTRESLLKDLELVQYHANSREFSACFAAIEIDRMNDITSKYGPDTGMKVLKHAGALCRQRLRIEDTTGLVSRHALGTILMQITPESSRVVLNRLRWAISSMPLVLPDDTKLSLTVSVAFHMINNTPPVDILSRCEEALSNLRDKGGNLIDQVGV
jgi:diguanylate cyclase (GGDEF)-like protein